MIDSFAAVARDGFALSDSSNPQTSEHKRDTQNMPLWRRNAASSNASSSNNARTHQRSNSEPMPQTSTVNFQLPDVPAVSSDWGAVITPMLVENHNIVGQGTARMSLPVIPEWVYNPDAPPRYEAVEHLNDEALNPDSLVPVDADGNLYPEQEPPVYTAEQTRIVRQATSFRPRNGELTAADFPSLSGLRPLTGASGSARPRDPVVEIVELRDVMERPQPRRA